MELSLIEIWESMGLLARLVAIALVLMGLASLAISIERLLVLRRINRESNLFAGKARTLIEAGELDALNDLAKGLPRNPLARLTVVGLATFAANARNAGLSAAEATRRELARKLEEYSGEARRGMSMLASVGSTAPFIGLFGTVIGIITAFQGIAASGG
ncbi:MAG: MotA/TolQ/ExbB proton channel family protein, partial [Myxococcales bacterium]|nr:MotA/TolQ/ExbB proton channel family protein [Myxococcales bacterium]